MKTYLIKGTDWRIATDSLCFHLQQKRVSKGTAVWATQGYFSTTGELLRGLAKYEILRANESEPLIDALKGVDTVIRAGVVALAKLIKTEEVTP